LHPDPAIARLAAAQHGVVSSAQLALLGLGRRAIAHRVGQGRLHRVHRGVYLVGHPVAPPLARETAAVLACGESAVLSHRSAAALWELLPAPPFVDVTVVRRNPRAPSGVRVHRSRSLEPDQVARRLGMPLTSPARTLLDLTRVLPDRPLERALEEALRLGLLAPGDVRGTSRRLQALVDRYEGPTLTRSEAEERLLALLRAARLPPPELNVRVGRREVDCLWRDAALVVEVDGYAYHSSRAAFERDRLRDAELQAAGYRVVRVTWRQLTEEPAALVARLAQALARS
jgi:very-short-patch-repair endonuclease